MTPAYKPASFLPKPRNTYMNPDTLRDKYGFIKGSVTARPLSNKTTLPGGSQGTASQYVPGSSAGASSGSTTGTTANRVSQIQYTDPTGKQQVGYLSNGQTFQDQAMTQRILPGSIVNTDGGTFRMTSSGGIMTPQSAVNQYKTNTAGHMDGFAAAHEAQERANKSATEAALARISQSEEQARRNTVDMNRAAYQNYVRSSDPYGAAGQQRAALGLANSGLAESSQVALGSAYQGAMSDNQIQEQQALAELAAQRNEAMLSGDQASAQAAAEYANLIAQYGIQNAQTILNAQLGIHDSAISELQADRQFGLAQSEFDAGRDDVRWSQGFAEQGRQDDLDAQSYERARAEALYRLQLGGATAEDAALFGVPMSKLSEIMSPQVAQAVSGGGVRRSAVSGGGGGGTSKTAPPKDDDNGDYDPDVDPDPPKPAAPQMTIEEIREQIPAVKGKYAWDVLENGPSTAFEITNNINAYKGQINGIGARADIILEASGLTSKDSGAAAVYKQLVDAEVSNGSIPETMRDAVLAYLMSR